MAQEGIADVGGVDLQKNVLGVIPEMKESNDSLLPTASQPSTEYCLRGVPQKFLLIFALDTFMFRASKNKEESPDIIRKIVAFLSVASANFEVVILTEEYYNEYWSDTDLIRPFFSLSFRMVYPDSQAKELDEIIRQYKSENIIAILNEGFTHLFMGKVGNLIQTSSWWEAPSEDRFLKSLTKLLSKGMGAFSHNLSKLAEAVIKVAQLISESLG